MCIPFARVSGELLQFTKSHCVDWNNGPVFSARWLRWPQGKKPTRFERGKGAALCLRRFSVLYQGHLIQGQWPTCTLLEMTVTAWNESEEERREGGGWRGWEGKRGGRVRGGKSHQLQHSLG